MWGFARVKLVYNPSSFSTDSAKAVPLLLLFFAGASVVLYVTYIFSLYVCHISFYWCREKAVFRDFGISWIFQHTSSRKHAYVILTTLNPTFI